MDRILFLAYHFPPIGGGGVQRNAKFARYLPELGYLPLVVTGPGRAAGRWTPEDESLMSEIPGEVPVHRIPGPEPEPATGRRAALERRLMIRTPFTRWWVRGAVELGKAVGGEAALVYGSLVPYESAEAAATLARALRKPWVADLQDPWALDEMWLYPSSLHRRLDLRRMRSVLATADAVVMNTPEAAARVLSRFPELRSKPVVSIPNGFDAEDFHAPAPAQSNGTFRIAHAGYLHTEDGLRLRERRKVRRLLGGLLAPVDILTRSHVYLLEAIERLVARQPALASVIEVVLAGVTSDTDIRLGARYPFVRMPGYLPHAETVALLRSADLLFLPMHDLPDGLRAGLVPGKTYEYLAAGRPILAAVPQGDARDLLTDAGNALLCPPADVDQMATIIGRQIERWRAGLSAPAPRADVVARYERRRQAEQLAGVFSTVVGR